MWTNFSLKVIGLRKIRCSVQLQATQHSSWIVSKPMRCRSPLACRALILIDTNSVGHRCDDRCGGIQSRTFKDHTQRKLRDKLNAIPVDEPRISRITIHTPVVHCPYRRPSILLAVQSFSTTLYQSIIRTLCEWDPLIWTNRDPRLAYIRNLAKNRLPQRKVDSNPEWKDAKHTKKFERHRSSRGVPKNLVQ